MADVAAIDRGPPRLPAEVLEIIFVMAATGDQQTACSLALVSHAVCRLTMKARSSTAVLTSMKAAKRFMVTFHHSPHFHDTLCGGRLRYNGVVAETLKDLGDKQLLSLPERDSRDLDNLYIAMHDFHQQDWHDFLQLLAESYHLQFGPCCWQCEERAEKEGRNIDLSVKNLSLGEGESSYHYQQPRQPLKLYTDEVTIVIDGSASSDSLDGWLRSRPLQKLHVVGRDSTSEDAGLSPPFKLLEQSRAGSSETLGGNNKYKASWWSAPKVTHLRWDTRRFAYQPIEITVRRLAPLLREVCFVNGPPQGDTNAQASSNDTLSSDPSQKVTLQRHRGVDRGGVASVWDEDTPEAEQLRQGGVGRFERLHFAWELPRKLLELQNAQREGDDGAGEQRGGWPRESYDVWTQRNHHGKAQTFHSELMEAITDAYGWAPIGASRKPSKEESAGWLGQYRFVDTVAGHMIEEVESGTTEDRQRLQAIEQRLAARVEEEQQREKARKEKKPISMRPRPARTREEQQPVDVRRRLKFAARAPSTLLKLGGATAALDSETRLALFLDRAKGGPGSWA